MVDNGEGLRIGGALLLEGFIFTFGTGGGVELSMIARLLLLSLIRDALERLRPLRRGGLVACFVTCVVVVVADVGLDFVGLLSD